MSSRAFPFPDTSSGLTRRRSSHRAPSTSTYVPRIQAEQARIEAQLVELEGVDAIQRGLKNTKLVGEDDMSVDTPPEPPASQMIEAKRNALAKFVPILPSQSAFRHQLVDAVLNCSRHALRMGRIKYPSFPSKRPLKSSSVSML